MSQHDKNETRDRYLREWKKHGKTRAEEKALQEEARRRKAERQSSKRTARKKRAGRPENAEDEWGEAEDSFEKIGRSPRFRREKDARLPPGGPQAPVDSGDATAEKLDLEASTEGIVIATHRDRIEVEVEGATLSVPRERDIEAVVGDRALLRESEGASRLVGLAPRRTQLARLDPSDPRRERVLAANVDHAVIVASTRRPTLRVGLVERILLALRRGGPTPIVCLSKVDLLANAEERAEVSRAIAPWQSRGVPCLFVSSTTGEGVDELRDALADTTCVFVGHSGVGKSSLVNALDPSVARRIGHVRDADGKGRHTTTSSRMITLTSGARLIDTPGVRQFGLPGVTRADLDEAFPDVAVYAARCRFADCAHSVEPDCAVRAALDENELPAERVSAYLRLRHTGA